MYLRRFADENQILAMVDRDAASVASRVSVNNAVNEVGYYAVPASELSDPPTDHDPEFVERMFSQVEGAASVAIDSILGGEFPPPETARTDLSLFIATQITRTWTWRRDFEQLTAFASDQFVSQIATPERVLTYLQSQGEPRSPRDVTRFIDHMLARPPRIVPGQGNYVEYMLEHANGLAPHILDRRWRLLDFGEPVLLTSDEPVALLRRPGEDVGPMNARAMWLPLDRTRALAITFSGHEHVVSSGSVRARQINSTVATQAYRWIFHHPADNPLTETVVGPRIHVVQELVSVRPDGDEVTERWKYVKRPIE